MTSGYVAMTASFSAAVSVLHHSATWVAVAPWPGAPGLPIAPDASGSSVPPGARILVSTRAPSKARPHEVLVGPDLALQGLVVEDQGAVLRAQVLCPVLQGRHLLRRRVPRRLHVGDQVGPRAVEPQLGVLQLVAVALQVAQGVGVPAADVPDPLEGGAHGGVLPRGPTGRPRVGVVGLAVPAGDRLGRRGQVAELLVPAGGDVDRLRDPVDRAGAALRPADRRLGGRDLDGDGHRAGPSRPSRRLSSASLSPSVWL